MPYRRIDMSAAGVDYLALSGHKLYAPFGAGALVGRPDWLRAGEPFLAGGGAVRYVGTDTVVWADLPDRQEAGSPNVVGAVALGVACRTLVAADLDKVARTETAQLAAVPGVDILRLWPPEHPRIGVLPFVLRSQPYAQLAAALSAEHASGVRHGCFCAHRLMVRLLGVSAARDASIHDALVRGAPAAMPGAVRVSIGLGTRAHDLARLVDAVAELAVSGPRWSYRCAADGTDFWPDPDPRPRRRFRSISDDRVEEPG